MKVIGATREQLDSALAQVNVHFHDNITFRSIEERKPMRNGNPVFLLTLGVKDSHEIGSRRSPRDWARMAHACWHAYGTLMDVLPAGTRIYTSTWLYPGDKWHDFPIAQNPVVMCSHACNCMEWNTGGVLPFPVNV